MSEHVLTSMGRLVSALGVVIDAQANGAIVELGHYFYMYMSLLSVFCTNAINIYAGINGLECGQAYIIACSILFYKLYEIVTLQHQSLNNDARPRDWSDWSILYNNINISNNNVNINDNLIFTIIMVMPFIAVILSLLRSNWYPARVFVGDTFCYFAGMTFAVLGIHGHFSKTLLLLFLPQIVNFVYSVPQLFKIIPCPRHRLPRINVDTGLMYFSAFPCQPAQHQWFKVHREATECPNCTLICLVLRCSGPLHEKTLCTVLLSIQALTSVLVFFLRYYVFENQ
jgi:UDP-N-acetylglucosamine--dolichyl-phosphate N-acetylglucosaminephosphotransferase